MSEGAQPSANTESGEQQIRRLSAYAVLKSSGSTMTQGQLDGHMENPEQIPTTNSEHSNHSKRSQQIET